IHYRYSEAAGFLAVVHPAHRGFESDVLTHIAFLHPAQNVVLQDRAGWIRWNRTAEMLLEGIVREFETFLGAVRPQVPVHAAVHRFTVLVQARTPRVVPLASPLGLFLVAYDLGDVRPAIAGRGECAQLREPAGSCA